MSPHKVDGGSAEEAAAPSSSSSPLSRHWSMGAEAFSRRMPHHDGIKALWETKWKFPCTKSVYPFHDGQFEDFEPIFNHLIEKDINDGTSIEYTRAFMPVAQALDTKGDEATKDGEKEKASDLYLRAACILRIARFPYITSFPEISCSEKWKAWEFQKQVYAKAGKWWTSPLQEVDIPHAHKKGADRDSIPVYVRVPEKMNGKKCPAVLLLTGLDGYRPDNTLRCEEFLARGWAAVIAEIPGTADCPADPADPESPDRLWDSVFEWMGKDGRFDMSHLMCWGLSSGGYYAIRIAHTHKDRLRGCVAHGAGCHYFFDRQWLEKADGHEYPFQLTPALAMKHGYKSVEEYMDGAQAKFSLLEGGIIQKPSCRLLLINGTHDGLMPIEDSTMLFEYGSPKEARFYSNALHMGYPMANASVYPWMESVMGTLKDVRTLEKSTT
ncbi:Alpha/Beta hydrolase protein [Pseudomassariella vexata]|uniref:Alpha/Beta hydrolase protein n=1 Tax=Pseudomassariella vexata TaxID=1141098 RepID=A0A1Y2DMY2_9PEZI|nr:Alpha/Beta hydrolase protein [Pseudomassariella vexata]ORY60653.1 Alpha/Beta hydrolase protein [Pseudomassariella vexata]